MSHSAEGMPSATSGLRAPQFQFGGHTQHRQQQQQPPPFSMRNFRYELDVVQQPVRARMCGKPPRHLPHPRFFVVDSH